MSFYLRPPKGMTNVHKLEESVLQRLTCYENLSSGGILGVISQLECLMEDSILDRSGHYLFRLLALKNNTFYGAFLDNETKLLKVRLGCYQKVHLKSFVKKLKKQAFACLEVVSVEGDITVFFNELIKVLFKMLKKGYFDHGLEHDFEACGNCTPFIIKVPFSLCPDLVASRQMALKAGYLETHCFNWKEVLLSLFRNYLILVLKEMKHSSMVNNTLGDERIREVLELVKNAFFQNRLTPLVGVKFDLLNFERESGLFPMCMENLYKVLQKNNRLSHNSRFDFSLFLKCIGMRLEDSMKFWETAYSKQHSTCSKCTHSWQTNEKRYIYGIRHMYGLEGSRRSYQVKSCQQIEELVLGANEEGGCPFRHFDDLFLKNALQSQESFSEDDIEVIIHTRRNNPRKACVLHLNGKLKGLNVKEGDVVGFSNPSEYYLLLKNLVS